MIMNQTSLVNDISFKIEEPTYKTYHAQAGSSSNVNINQMQQQQMQQQHKTHRNSNTNMGGSLMLNKNNSNNNNNTIMNNMSLRQQNLSHRQSLLSLRAPPVLANNNNNNNNIQAGSQQNSQRNAVSLSNLPPSSNVGYKVNVYQVNSNSSNNGGAVNGNINNSSVIVDQQQKNEQTKKANSKSILDLFKCKCLKKKTNNSSDTQQTNKYQGWKIFLFFCTQLLEKFFFFTMFLYALPTQILQIIIGLVYGAISTIKYFLFLYIITLSTSKAELSANSSEEDSVASNKLRFCNKCEEKVNQEDSHCDVCKKCVYKQLFHSYLLSRCISLVNQSYMQVMVVMNIIEGVICIVVDVIQLAKIISDENSAKSSMAEIYKDQSKYALIGLSIGILVMLCLSTFINIRFLIFIRNSLKVSLAAQNGQRQNLNVDQAQQLQQQQSQQQRQQQPDQLNRAGQTIIVDGQLMRIDGLIASSIGTKQQQQLLRVNQRFQPEMLQQQYNISNGREKRAFESHWKISPPDRNDPKYDDQQSLNSSGTIFNFIQRKIASCENLDKMIANSPAKSIKSLSALDHSGLRQVRTKSQNFSDMEIVLKNSPDRGLVMTTSVVQNASQYSRHKRSGTNKPSSSLSQLQQLISMKGLTPIEENLVNTIQDGLPDIQEGMHYQSRDVDVATAIHTIPPITSTYRESDITNNNLKQSASMQGGASIPFQKIFYQSQVKKRSF